MGELLDRVDENDKIIGTTTKDEAHKQGHIHRMIMGIDDNGDNDNRDRHHYSVTIISGTGTVFLFLPINYIIFQTSILKPCVL